MQITSSRSAVLARIVISVKYSFPPFDVSVLSHCCLAFCFISSKLRVCRTFPELGRLLPLVRSGASLDAILPFSFPVWVRKQFRNGVTLGLAILRKLARVCHSACGQRSRVSVMRTFRHGLRQVFTPFRRIVSASAGTIQRRLTYLASVIEIRLLQFKRLATLFACKCDSTPDCDVLALTRTGLTATVFKSDWLHFKRVSTHLANAS